MGGESVGAGSSSASTVKGGAATSGDASASIVPVSGAAPSRLTAGSSRSSLLERCTRTGLRARREPYGAHERRADWEGTFSHFLFARTIDCDRCKAQSCRRERMLQNAAYE